MKEDYETYELERIFGSDNRRGLFSRMIGRGIQKIIKGESYGVLLPQKKR
jgi:hypothetical protein